jgi:hypothetical protein
MVQERNRMPAYTISRCARWEGDGTVSQVDRVHEAKKGEVWSVSLVARCPAVQIQRQWLLLLLEGTMPSLTCSVWTSLYMRRPGWPLGRISHGGDSAGDGQSLWHMETLGARPTNASPTAFSAALPSRHVSVIRRAQINHARAGGLSFSSGSASPLAPAPVTRRSLVGSLGYCRPLNRASTRDT